jgi:hypothetical protein
VIIHTISRRADGVEIFDFCPGAGPVAAPAQSLRRRREVAQEQPARPQDVRNKHCGDDREQELRVVGRDCLEPRPEPRGHEIGRSNPAPEGTDVNNVTSRYRRDAEGRVPLDGRREPEAVGAGAVVLELRQRRHGLHHYRCRCD